MCSLELRGQAKPINFEGVSTYFWPYIGMVLWAIAVGVLEFIKKIFMKNCDFEIVDVHTCLFKYLFLWSCLLIFTILSILTMIIKVTKYFHISH